MRLTRFALLFLLLSSTVAAQVPPGEGDSGTPQDQDQCPGCKFTIQLYWSFWRGMYEKDSFGDGKPEGGEWNEADQTYDCEGVALNPGAKLPQWTLIAKVTPIESHRKPGVCVLSGLNCSESESCKFTYKEKVQILATRSCYTDIWTFSSNCGPTKKAIPDTPDDTVEIALGAEPGCNATTTTCSLHIRNGLNSTSQDIEFFCTICD